MAKRVASIPRFDKSEKSGRPGYYPARNLEYGESEEDLDRKKGNKRISIKTVLQESQAANTGQRKVKGSAANKGTGKEKKKNDNAEGNMRNGKVIEDQLKAGGTIGSRKRDLSTAPIRDDPIEGPSAAKLPRVAKYQEYEGIPSGGDILGSEADDEENLESSDCSEDQTVIPEQVHKNKVEFLEKKIRRLENKLSQQNVDMNELRSTLDKAISLNLQYQTDVIGKLLFKIQNCSCSTTTPSNPKNDTSKPPPAANLTDARPPATSKTPAPPTKPAPPTNPAPPTKPAVEQMPAVTINSVPSRPAADAPTSTSSLAPAPAQQAVPTIEVGTEESLDHEADNPIELAEIHPGVTVNRACWERIAECVEAALANSAKYPNTEPGNRDFVYAVAQQMWGTDVLSSSTVTGKTFKGQKNADGTVVTPLDNALPPIELATVHGALRKKLLLFNNEDIKRSSLTFLKNIVRQKIHNIKKSVKK